MKSLLRKMIGGFAAMLLAVIEAAMGIATVIGLTTTAADAKENLPPIIVWLLGTPWWVPAFIIPLLMAAVIAWAFWPDLSLTRELRKARVDFKDANARSWAFEPEFKHAMEELNAVIAEIRGLVEGLAALPVNTQAQVDRIVAEITDGQKEEINRNITYMIRNAVNEKLDDIYRVIEIQQKERENSADRMNRHLLQSQGTYMREFEKLKSDVERMRQSQSNTGPGITQ